MERTQMLQFTVEDLLSYFQLKTNTFMYEAQRFDIKKAVSDCISFQKSNIEAKNI